MVSVAQIFLSESGWYTVIYRLLQLAPLLDSLLRVWRNLFFPFSSLLHPHKGSSLVYIVDLQCLLLHCLAMLLKAWNTFLSCRTKEVSILGSCSLLKSHLGVVCWFGLAALSFSLTFAVTRRWSLLGSAPLLTHTSSRERPHMLITIRWSIVIRSCTFADV